MKLQAIVTLANQTVRLRFLAMERSLRATGCDLPLQVIPFDGATFPLPPKATWWEMPEVTAWLAAHGASPMMRKYQCLLIENYQFVDADVCFLRDPSEVLSSFAGFVTSCGHWHNPAETTTDESRGWLAARSTTWQKHVFNAGQFACDRALYTWEALKARAEAAEFQATCLRLPFHEQPGLNLLVNATGVPVHNLTLPPWNMQSSWAGDYSGDFRSYWRSLSVTPYLIHWAGVKMHVPRPINAVFLDFLTKAERVEWDEFVHWEKHRRDSAHRTWRARARRWRAAWQTLHRP